MPDRDYTVTFKVDTTQALAGIGAFKTELKALDGYVNGLGGVANKTAGSIDQMADSIANATAKTDVHTQSAKNSTAGMVAMGAAIGGVNMAMMAGINMIGELGEMATKARDHIKELAIETMGLRDQMRELANLKGKDGPDNEVVAETVKMGVEAGMMPDDMRKYLEQYEGSSPAGVQMGHIDDKTKQELALEGAKFANRMKITPQTGGDLAGVISQYTDLTKDKDGNAIPQEQRKAIAMAQMGRISYGLNEGRGNLEPLVKSLINTAGSTVGGPVEDLGELGAIIGVSSTHANPKEAGTRVRQAIRALRDTNGPAGSFLKNVAKITDQDTHIQRLEKLKPLLDAAKKNGKDADIALRGMGFTDEDEIRAVAEEVQDLDLIKQRIAKGKAEMTGQAVMQADDNFLNRDKAGMRRKQLANKAAQEFLKGEESERIELAKENAEQQLRDEGKIGGTANNLREKFLDAGGIRTRFLGGESAREIIKYQRAEENLIKEAQKVGISEDDAKRALGYSDENDEGDKDGELHDNRDERQRVKGFNALADKVESNWGKPTGEGPNTIPKLNELIEQNKQMNATLKFIAEQKAQNPVGPPKQFMTMPGAAPKRP